VVDPEFVAWAGCILETTRKINYQLHVTNIYFFKAMNMEREFEEECGSPPGFTFECSFLPGTALV
jgi:hypothetical protein